ncbi:MAG: hypothetical protein HKN31_09025, partial [Pricia sp.]|nr:hypothetical protein [Pricia sp.]
MKTLKFYLFFLIVFLGVSVSCEKSNSEDPFNETTIQGEENSNALANKKGGTRTIPFKAKFYTKRNYDVVIGTCDEDPYLGYNYQVGEGTATHMGKIKAELYFCGVPNAFDYKNGEGVFVAANGDELWYLVPSPGETGLVKPLPYP